MQVCRSLSNGDGALSNRNAATFPNGVQPSHRMLSPRGRARFANERNCQGDGASLIRSGELRGMALDLHAVVRTVAIADLLMHCQRRFVAFG